MSTCKYKLNPDWTEFIFFGSKKQRDKQKACFPSGIIGTPVYPAESEKNLCSMCGLTLISPCPKISGCNSVFVQLRHFKCVRLMTNVSRLIKLLDVSPKLLSVVG